LRHYHNAQNTNRRTSPSDGVVTIDGLIVQTAVAREDGTDYGLADAMAEIADLKAELAEIRAQIGRNRH
jgi:hypothetical protein